MSDFFAMAVLERVRRTGSPILVTRRGEPIAQVFPPSPGKHVGHWIGGLVGRARIVGDVVAPAADPQDWEALRS